MPEIGINIISQSEMQGNHYTIFHKNQVVIKTKANNIIATGKKINNLYHIDIEEVVHQNQVYNITDDKYTNREKTRTTDSLINQTESHNIKTIDLKDLHAKMGHIAAPSIAKLIHNTQGYNKVTNNKNIDLTDCEICLRSKFTNKINKSMNQHDFDDLEKVSSDICGPISPSTYDNYRYFITFLDIKTRFLDIKLLRTKDEAYEAFLQFSNVYENNSNNKRIRILATDNGTEFVNKRFRTLLDHKGIIHQLAPAYTKEPNGIIERVNRTITNKIRCLLKNASLPMFLWGEACLTATYLYNRTPHSSINFKTPFEAKYNKQPDISNIRTFGSVCFYKNKGNHVRKLDDKAIKGILVGFNDSLYKVYNLETKKTIWVRDIHIMENKFLNWDSSTTSQDSVNLESLTYNSNMNQMTNPVDYNIESTNQDIETTATLNVNSLNNIIDANENEIDELAQDITVDPLHYANPPCKIVKSITTHSTNNQIMENCNDDDVDELTLLITINDEPSTFKQAQLSSDREKWQDAMQAEIDELERQNTWTITDLPADKQPLKGRWVFKIKTDLNNKIIKYKARWVVKGFNQKLGIDYLETFSSTCRPESYRVIFVLAMHHGWPLTQYDVKNAFIHAHIDKEIYVEQPHGFVKENVDQSVGVKYCKLNKALYGLKQSPRLWYEHLLGVLTNFGFTTMPYDSAIFIQEHNKTIIICHVDDLIITGPNQGTINQIIDEISKSVKLEKIGDVNQFLGMQICPDYNTKSLSINQSKYTSVLLERFGKNSLRPVSSPVELGVNLEPSIEKADQQSLKAYQQQVGSLIYLAINTRPDISFAVNRCARYMSNPNQSHFRALDRIWKYLNHYPDLGLNYNCQIVNQNVLGYTDSDWGGDTIARKSTSGYLFLLNGNVISWVSMQQKTVALSSCEAEYMAYREAIKESTYLHNLTTYYFRLLDMKIFNEPPKILSDSESALKLAHNPEFHKRTKHIDIQYHYIRQSVKENLVRLLQVSTKNQLADGFTKGLDTIKHNSFILSLKLK